MGGDIVVDGNTYRRNEDDKWVRVISKACDSYIYDEAPFLDEIERLRTQHNGFAGETIMKRLFKTAEREPQDGESREVGLAREISRLRVQVGELLPWAQSEVSDIVHNAADGRSTYIVKAAAELLARIENGEFGNVS